MIAVSILLFCAGAALAQSPNAAVPAKFVCPKEDGFYRDPVQCDKYYDCYRGEMTENLCPDGLNFDSSLGPRTIQCNYPFIAPCETEVTQEAQPSGIECPRQNGYFEHEDPANCIDYYECTQGTAVKRSCADGLVFDEFTGACQWENDGYRTNCGTPARVTLEDGFFCPEANQLATNGQHLDHARYLHSTNCRLFYVCINNKFPTLSGCPEGTVFNDLTLNCDDPANVPECIDYYKGPGEVAVDDNVRPGIRNKAQKQQQQQQ